MAITTELALALCTTAQRLEGGATYQWTRARGVAGAGLRRTG